MEINNRTRNLIMEHYHTYPDLQIQDLFKFLFQSSFGCEHLLTDSSATVDYIQKEAADCYPHIGELIEPLDREYCRVHLDYLKKGLNAETFGKLFFLSAKSNKCGKKVLEEKLSVMKELIKEGLLPFSEEKANEAIAKWCELGYPACHHSEQFRNAYHPAYRLLKKEYALFLPLFIKIDSLLAEHDQVTIAIEGGSASGKTTLGELLAQVYNCNVFHMDDFFLRPEQRTKERFAEAGGNVDRERFLSEVLIPLSKNKVFSYQPFDCSTFTLSQPREVTPKQLNIIEGAYSMHPLLAGYYDYSIFLDITPKLQKERILKRNSPDMTKRFFNEWIPLEQTYFDALHIKEQCSQVFSILD